MTAWLKNNKFKAHLIAFFLMILTSMGMIFIANSESSNLIWGLLAVFALANVLAIFIK